MRRTTYTLIALLVALSVAAVGAQTYGTKVDASWYDMVAEVYQQPPMERAGADSWFLTRPYRDVYGPVILTREIGEGQTVSFRRYQEYPDGRDCVLYGVAGLAEEMMHLWVTELGNLYGRQDAYQFKQALLHFTDVGADIIAVDTDGHRAVVLIDGVRHPISSAVNLPPWPSSTRIDEFVYRLQFFSIPVLEANGAIVDDKFTIATNITPSGMCTFDLTDLP